jgi:midasin
MDETDEPDAASRDAQDGDVPRAEDEEMAPLPEEERLDDGAAELEASLLALREADAEERAARAADLWRAYSALTSDLSFGLCEQLRLILAPTLATRLNGDFRTGKRLNMRKIVPFIASDFAKDKIWLRRTKPSAREYQVLLAVDDSRSMAESHSAHLAYQTLALVSGALGRLEVGDVSICRFGQAVETLHPFGRGPLGDAQGAHVLEKLSFEQRGTDVLRLVEHSLKTLEAAREQRAASASAAELWQLEIIISDGICQVSADVCASDGAIADPPFSARTTTACEHCCARPPSSASCLCSSSSTPSSRASPRARPPRRAPRRPAAPTLRATRFSA